MIKKVVYGCTLPSYHYFWAKCFPWMCCAYINHTGNHVVGYGIGSLGVTLALHGENARITVLPW